MTVPIIPNGPGHSLGKLADAERHSMDGPLEGLTLIGFNVWLPARKYPMNSITPSPTPAISNRTG